MSKQEKIKSTPETQQIEKAEIGGLEDFDMDFFQEIDEDNWIALGNEDYKNQKYFTVKGTKGENLGIIGVFDTNEDTNVTHTIVAPEFRGNKLAAKFKHHLMDKLDLDHITLIINYDPDHPPEYNPDHPDFNPKVSKDDNTTNWASIRATEKIEGVRRVSDEAYEKEFHKVKFIYEKPPNKVVE